MALVKGPLFSLEASGSYGGALVFAKNKGRQYCRELVIPANPNSADQEAARNMVRVGGAIQKWVNQSTLKGDSRLVTDLEAIKAITPSGFSWNGYLVETLIGTGALTYAAGVAAYTALTGGQKTAWDTAAEALTPAYADVYQTQEGGSAATPMPSGEVFFLHQYTLYKMGILASAPSGTPNVYA